MARSRSISGLRLLRLQIDYDMDATLYELVKGHNLFDTAMPCEGRKRLSTWPWTDVEIAVRDMPFTFLNQSVDEGR